MLLKNSTILKGAEYGKSIVFLVQAAANFGQRSKPSSPADFSDRAENVVDAFCFCLSTEMLQLIQSGVAADVSSQVIIYLNECVLAWLNSLLVVASSSESTRNIIIRQLASKYYLVLSKAIVGASVISSVIDLCRLIDQVIIDYYYYFPLFNFLFIY